MADKHLRKLGGAVYSSKKAETVFGLKILEKCGWKDGDGLGKNRHGMKECIQVTKRYDAEGLGKSKQKMNDTWWEDNYNTILTSIKVNKKEKQINKERSRSNSLSSTHGLKHTTKKDSKPTENHRIGVRTRSMSRRNSISSLAEKKVESKKTRKQSHNSNLSIQDKKPSGKKKIKTKIVHLKHSDSESD